MKNIITIASKEFLDTLRDRRTLIMMVFIPVLVFPVIFTLVNRLQTSVMQREQERPLSTGLISHDPGNELEAYLAERPDIRLITIENEEDLRMLIRSDSLQVGLVIAADFSENISAGRSGNMAMHYSATKLTVKSRIDRVIDGFSDEKLRRRILDQGLDEQFMTPIQVSTVNVASEQEVIGKMAGGFLPYLFVIFCFMGAMYPAIDLFTGEKERKTLETILTTPVSRLEILIGKMMVIVATGVTSAILAIAGLFLAFRTTPDIPGEFFSVVAGMLSLSFILLTLLMLLPLTVFFAGVMIPLTIYAKSYKEAQSMLSPFTFLVIVPAMIGLLPGIELTTATALIPIVNISLATKEILAGTIELPLLLLTIGSLFTYAALSVLFCFRWFGNESNVLR